MKLDQPFIERVRRGIEKAIVPAMEKIFRFEGDTFDETYCPGVKLCEKVVDYYDYRPCGISVLAPLALRGNRRARRLIAKIHK